MGFGNKHTHNRNMGFGGKLNISSQIGRKVSLYPLYNEPSLAVTSLTL